MRSKQTASAAVGLIDTRKRSKRALLASFSALLPASIQAPLLDGNDSGQVLPGTCKMRPRDRHQMREHNGAPGLRKFSLVLNAHALFLYPLSYHPSMTSQKQIFSARDLNEKPDAVHRCSVVMCVCCHVHLLRGSPAPVLKCMGPGPRSNLYGANSSL